MTTPMGIRKSFITHEKFIVIDDKSEVKLSKKQYIAKAK